MEKQSSPTQIGFAQHRLPWLLALGTWILFLTTLVRWATFDGLPTLAKATGWDWRVPLNMPLQFLLTYPVRWLPEAWQLTGLNLMASLCGAATLGLLARCVAILPHDRTKEQRQLERSDYSFLTIKTAWIPPILAVLVCGLQLTFWEHAVVATGEMLNLLLFAFVVWSLLEFRLDEKPWRLLVAAFVYGLGITNNFAMIAFFPVFVASVLWIKGLAFFNPGFLVRMATAGAVGLLLYLVLPLANSVSGLTHLGFGDVLLVHLGFQKSMILGFPRYLILIIGLTSLVPVLFIGIRWQAQVGDISAAGANLTRFMTMVVHGAFLAACIVTAFDPPFGPRRMGGGMAFLPFYFLSALSVGYFAGYFLLVCGTQPVKSWERPSPIIQWLNKALVFVIWLCLPVVPSLLLAHNYPQLKAATDNALAAFGRAAVESLPEEPSVVLSDDPIRLNAFRVAANVHPKTSGLVIVDTTSLRFPAYHRWQHRRHPDFWPDTFLERDLQANIEDVELLAFIHTLQETRRLYYLHPSFGFFFERFYDSPENGLFRLQPLPPGVILPPNLAEDTLSSSANYLESLYADDSLQSLRERISREGSSKDRDPLTRYMSQIYSMNFNQLGVTLQKSGQLERANAFFDMALALNPENATAFINRDFNAYLRDPQGDPPGPSEGTLSRLKPFGGDWARILGMNGPVDEPTSCFLLAQTLVQGMNLVQAAQQFIRAIQLNPKLYPAQIALAGVYVKLSRPDDASQLIALIKQSVDLDTIPLDARLRLLESEAWTLVGQQRFEEAKKLLENAQETHPGENLPYSTLANIYLAQGNRTNAIGVYELQLTRQTNNVPVQINLSALRIMQADYAASIELLDRALSLDPKNPGALINRAIAHLRVNNLSAARRDYEMLLEVSNRPVAMAVYGLGEIAWLEKNYPLALKHYQRFLKVASPRFKEFEEVRRRVEQIQSGTL